MREAISPLSCRSNQTGRRARFILFIVTNTEVSYGILAQAARWRIFGKSPANLYLRLSKQIWHRLPSRLRNSRLIRSYGASLHALVCACATRRQFFGTMFLRNRPALEFIRRLAEQKVCGATLRIAVLACSIGAEVYSILFTIRSARPDLRIVLHAVDISKEILSFAETGVYDSNASELVNWPIFERLTAQEKQQLFDWDRDQAKVKSWLREGIVWTLGDAADPELVSVLGVQDLVVGSNFLCHMDPADAEKCLRNMALLVRPGGHLFVSGVDLNVRTKVAVDLGWKPVPDLKAEIHDGDQCIRADWPWQWWGLEPLDQRRSDWQIRYAAVFRYPEAPYRTNLLAAHL